MDKMLVLFIYLHSMSRLLVIKHFFLLNVTYLLYVLVFFCFGILSFKNLIFILYNFG